MRDVLGRPKRLSHSVLAGTLAVDAGRPGNVMSGDLRRAAGRTVARLSVSSGKGKSMPLWCLWLGGSLLVR